MESRLSTLRMFALSSLLSPAICSLPRHCAVILAIPELMPHLIPEASIFAQVNES